MTNKSNRNLHAPYARSVSVQGSDGSVLSLSVMNFFLWLEERGALDAFEMKRSNIERCKKRSDCLKRKVHKRQNQEGTKFVTKHKKRKRLMSQTDGSNYQTFNVEIPYKPPRF